MVSVKVPKAEASALFGLASYGNNAVSRKSEMGLRHQGIYPEGRLLWFAVRVTASHVLRDARIRNDFDVELAGCSKPGA